LIVAFRSTYAAAVCEETLSVLPLHRLGRLRDWASGQDQCAVS